MSALLIKNIKQLVQVREYGKGLPRQTPTPVRGKEMAELPSIDNAWILIKHGIIEDYGSMDTCPEDPKAVIDASGKLVLPAWCDSHTHLVFADTREEEFVGRIKGLTYEQIAAAGGGILNSAKKLADKSEEQLIASATERLNEIMHLGTGAVEIKSGYGLSVEGELKMLRVIKHLKENHPVTIKATFLGAHAIPADYKQNREEYIRQIIEEMLPVIAEEGLADYIDVFCETNYYTPEETSRILEAGKKHGLKPKIHVNQFTSIGGIQVGVENQAISVDHLEVMTEQDKKDLAASNVIPTVLPSCSFFLGIPYAPARELIEANLPLCLATDYNPGSTPSGNIPFVLSLACLQMKLLPEEAINAVTVNGAFAMELQHELGSITKGKKANLIITKPINSINNLPYSFGSNLVETVLINGRVAG
ncbi:MAG: imidazolonepropionase [Flavobacteriales bacterium]|nr:imidazolonepropionase [Flavobacteriales bacterium]